MSKPEYIKKPIVYIDYASAQGEVPKGIVKIDCGLGHSPFAPPRGVIEAVRASTTRDLSLYPSDAFTVGLGGLVRERFGLNRDTKVFFDGRGSYGILATLLNEMVDTRSKLDGLEVVGYGPQFTNIEPLIQRAGLKYRPIQEPLATTVDHKVNTLIADRLGAKNKPAIVYVDNPNNPTGQSVNPGTLRKLIDVCQKNGDVLIIDEAYGDLVDDSLSAIPFVEKGNNLIVVRSISKGIGLASPRLGYTLMSRNLEPTYGSINLVYSVDTLTRKVGEVALQPELLRKYLPDVRSKTGEIKVRLENGLARLGFDVHPSDPTVSIMMVRGRDNFYGDLLKIGILTEDGATFKPTHSDMNESIVRMRIPGNQALVDQVIGRMKKIA